MILIFVVYSLYPRVTTPTTKYIPLSLSRDSSVVNSTSSNLVLGLSFVRLYFLRFFLYLRSLVYFRYTVSPLVIVNGIYTESVRFFIPNFITYNYNCYSSIHPIQFILLITITLSPLPLDSPHPRSFLSSFAFLYYSYLLSD